MTKLPLGAPKFEQLHTSETDVDIVALPGILNPDHRWVDPLMPLFSKVGTVHNMVYGEGTLFNPDAAVELAADRLTASLAVGKRAVLFGSSLGGDLAPFIASEMKARDVATDNLSVVVADAPAGIETLPMIPEFAYPAARGLLRHLRPGTMLESVGNKTVMHLMTLPSGLPKDSEITVPGQDVMRALTGSVYGDAEWRAKVKQMQAEMLSGNSFGTYLTELAWMIEVGDNGTLEHAITTGLNGLEVYIAATKGNVTVSQPKAANMWRDMNPDMQIKEVGGPHCAYLQMQREWAQVINGIFNDLNLLAA